MKNFTIEGAVMTPKKFLDYRAKYADDKVKQFIKVVNEMTRLGIFRQNFLAERIEEYGMPDLLEVSSKHDAKTRIELINLCLLFDVVYGEHDFHESHQLLNTEIMFYWTKTRVKKYIPLWNDIRTGLGLGDF